MEQKKFGEILRSTRERKGLGFADTAQRLRIRPDILRAIEDSNVAAMPPRGYSRNMVTGYARYLGLDPNEMARLYVDELQAYEDRHGRVLNRTTAVEGATDADVRFGDSGAVRVSSRTVARDDVARGASGEMPRAQKTRNADSRESADDMRSTARINRLERDGSEKPRASSPRSSQQNQDSGNSFSAAVGSVAEAAKNFIGSRRRPSFNASGRGRQSRDPMLKANDYVTFYQETESPLEGKLPFIAAAAVLLLLLALILTLLFGHGGKKDEEVATMPVTSVEESTQQATEQAPSKFTFAYKIDDGVEAYTEIYLDENLELADILTGPAEGSYDVTGSIQILTYAGEAVHITIDGEEQELKYNDNGMVDMTFTYSDFLKKWQEAHGVKGASGSTSTEASQESGDTSTESTDASTDTQSQESTEQTTEETADATATEEVPADQTTVDQTYVEDTSVYYDDTSGTYYDDSAYTGYTDAGYADTGYTEEVYY